MSRLANISGRKAVKAFQRLGYKVDHQTGSHIILVHPDRHPLSIPNHKEVAPPLLRAQILRAGLTIDQFLKHL